MTEISEEELQANFAIWMSRIEQGEAVTISDAGKPSVVIVSWKEYLALKRQAGEDVDDAFNDWLANTKDRLPDDFESGA